jgi:Na+-transporting NADH:ubiquinone oxidoreductase subunit NqrC
MFVVLSIQADEMVHEFKSPSFSGVGTSSHYLTIENQETNRKEAIAEEIKALRDEIEREENNTVEARFMRNLTSRIYANIARQVEASLFGEDTNKSGSMELDGNTIEYEITDEKVKVTITDEDGNVTEVIVPVGGFTF